MGAPRRIALRTATCGPAAAPRPAADENVPRATDASTLCRDRRAQHHRLCINQYGIVYIPPGPSVKQRLFIHTDVLSVCSATVHRMSSCILNKYCLCPNENEVFDKFFQLIMSFS